MVFEEGPYVIGAFFCERVLRETDDVPSYIRVIDQISFAAEGKDLPDEAPAIPHVLTFVLALKAGQARGRHNVRLEFERADGSIRPILNQDVNFAKDNDGANLITIHKTTLVPGLYWMHAYVGDHEITRSPFVVQYERTIRS